MTDVMPIHHTPSKKQKPKTPSEHSQKTDIGPSPPRVTPKSTFVGSEFSRESMLPQQLLARRESIDLDDYFVSRLPFRFPFP
jgi:hypothetical protein